jgi:hypothetical protein
MCLPASFGMSGFLVLGCKNSPHKLTMWISTLGGSRVATDCTQVYNKGLALVDVNFRQPSHEFTFGVGIRFIS